MLRKYILDYRIEHILALVVILNFVLRIPLANSIAVNDEASYFQGVIHTYENRLNPFVEFDGYKPPVSTFVPAVFFTLFSPSRIWARLFIALCSSGALLLTYLLGTHLYTKRVGISAALLLFFLPMFMAQSFLFSDALPVAVLALATYYCYFRRNWLWYGISATLLVLTKETTPLLLFLLAAYEWYITGKTLSLPRHILRTLLLLLPIQALILWMLLNKIYLGWYIYPIRQDYLTKWLLFDKYVRTSMLNIANVMFTYYFYPLFWTIGIVAILIIRERKRLRSSCLLFIGVFLFSFGLFTIDYINGRYLLYTCPFLLLSATSMLSELVYLKNFRYFVVISLLGFIFLSLGLSNFFSNPIRERDDVFGFFYNRNLHRNVFDYIHTRYKKPVFVRKYPFFIYYDEPLLDFFDNYQRTVEYDKVIAESYKVKDMLLRDGFTYVLLLMSKSDSNQMETELPFFSLEKEFTVVPENTDNPRVRLYRWSLL